ncbi:uncharacterized protein LOC127143844 [Cucumis melo]|uniref:Uncharacterized protein LOC127143844 n=1 Tax=Cucumis melo TaxID=3656 RepID=A0ABM3KB90_CUCME|nr:uncharacterized protein LOC127143844 [Cucumis melo]
MGGEKNRPEPMTRFDPIRFGLDRLKFFFACICDFISSPLRRLFFTSSSANSVGIFSSSASASASTLHLHLFATPSYSSSDYSLLKLSCSLQDLQILRVLKHSDGSTSLRTTEPDPSGMFSRMAIQFKRLLIYPTVYPIQHYFWIYAPQLFGSYITH